MANAAMNDGMSETVMHHGVSGHGAATVGSMTAAALCATLDDADVATTALVETALALAASFRTMNAEAANTALPGFAEGLGTLVVITGEAAEGIGVELTAVGDGQGTAGEIVNDLVAHVGVLLTAQRDGDWLAAADVLEREIAPAVARWPAVLQAIRGAASVLTRVA